MKKEKNELVFLTVDVRTGKVIRVSRLSRPDMKQRCKLVHDILSGKAKRVKLVVEHGTTMIRPRAQSKSAEWADALMRYSKIYSTDHQAYLAMMADFEQGRYIPGIGTWLDVWIAEHLGRPTPPSCPHGWTPRGASYSAIMAALSRSPEVQFQRALRNRNAKEGK